jgi:hypothetical protein
MTTIAEKVIAIYCGETLLSPLVFLSAHQHTAMNFHRPDIAATEEYRTRYARPDHHKLFTT